jgi:chemotaxis protein methyltransferase CheR
VATLRESLLVLTSELTVEYANQAFLNAFEVSEEDTLKRPLSSLGNGQWNIPALLEPLSQIVADNTTIDDYEIAHTFERIGHRVMRMNARKINRSGDGSTHILLAIEDVTRERSLEAENAAALDYANRLLEELNHRVMNSLSMIGAMIALERRMLSDDQCRKAFERMRSRIDTVGTLYRTLTNSNSVDSVSADAYLADIVRDTVGSVGAESAQVAVDFSVDPVQLRTRLAVPLGLIVNELVTNSLKYAFPERDRGRLGLHMVVEGVGLKLTIWDDGGGIDDAARVDSGLGQKLVSAFVAQIGGTLSRESDATGTRHTLIFSNDRVGS